MNILHEHTDKDIYEAVFQCLPVSHKNLVLSLFDEHSGSNLGGQPRFAGEGVNNKRTLLRISRPLHLPD
jgi:hypothetical protein